MSATIAIVAALVMAPPPAAPPAPAPPPPALPPPSKPMTDWVGLSNEVLSTMEAHHSDWEHAKTWAAQEAGYAQGVTDAASFRTATQGAISRLGTSHAAWYGTDDPDHA